MSLSRSSPLDAPIATQKISFNDQGVGELTIDTAEVLADVWSRSRQRCITDTRDSEELAEASQQRCVPLDVYIDQLREQRSTYTLFGLQLYPGIILSLLVSFI